MGSDFVVESKGHCFLCLNKISNFKTDRKSPDSASICSLQSLSRHLKLDMRKVFSEKEAIPQFLLDKVHKSKLKVELCQKCYYLNKTFTEQYRQLEKIEMKMRSSLKLIHRTVLSADDVGKPEEPLKNTTGLMDGWEEKLNILHVIRKEATQKCSRVLGSFEPRVKVENMSRKKLTEEKFKLRTTTPSKKLYDNRSECTFEAEADPVIKTEQSLRNSLSEDNYDCDDAELPTDDWGMQSDNSDSINNERVTTKPIEDKLNAPSSQQSSRGEFVEMGRTASAANLIYDELTPVGLSLDDMPKASVNLKTGKHVCPLCSKDFGNSDGFRKHYKNLHLQVKYKCRLCKKTFSRISNCHEHYRSVHRGIRLQCRGCAKLFTKKWNLIAHQRTHNCGN